MPPKDNVCSIYIHTNDGATIELDQVKMCPPPAVKFEGGRYPMNFANPQEAEITLEFPKISFRSWVKMIGFWKTVRLYFRRMIERVKK